MAGLVSGSAHALEPSDVTGAASRVGGGELLAAGAGAALGASPFLEWYGRDSGIRCVRAPCPGLVAESGWEALGELALVLLGVGALGILLLVVGALLRGGRVRAGRRRPGDLPDGARAGGPRIRDRDALLFAPRPAAGAARRLRRAAGGWWAPRRRAALGPRSKRAADAGRLCLVAGAAVLVVSLALPWFETPGSGPGIGYLSLSPIEAPRGRVTGFEAFRVTDALLVALAVAVVGGALGGFFGDRLGLDVAAMLAAGLALAGLLVSVNRPALLLFSDGFSRECGVAVALAGAALALLGGGMGDAPARLARARFRRRASGRPDGQPGSPQPAGDRLPAAGAIRSLRRAASSGAMV